MADRRHAVPYDRNRAARDERDYFGYDVRFCGDCRYYEPMYVYSNPRPGVVGKTKRDRGECTRYGIVVSDRTIDEEGCWEDE